MMNNGCPHLTWNAIRSDLFQEQAKYNELKKMEGKWQVCQSELETLKVKYLLQSELGELVHVTSQHRKAFHIERF